MYGVMKVWDMNDLLYQQAQAAKIMVRSCVELYVDTAGEIEARDASNRRSKTEEQRKSSPPRLGNEDTVFAEGTVRADDYIPGTVSEKEIADNIKAVAEMKSVVSIKGDEFRMGDGRLLTDVTAFFESIGGSVYNSRLGDVFLRKRGVRHDLGHGMSDEKAASFAAIPAVLEHRQVVGFVVNKGGKGFDSATVVAPITIGNEPYMMGVIVHRSNKENRFYVHDVVAIKEEAAPLITGTQKLGETGGATSTISIIRKILSVKANQVESGKKFSRRKKSETEVLQEQNAKLREDVERLKELVKQQMGEAAKDGVELSYDEAFEEVVADAMEAMFTDTDALAKMEKLKAQDKSLWQEIQDFVLGLAEKIKAIYAGLKPDSAEGRYVLQMKESIDQFAQLFAEGVMAEKVKNTVEESGVRFSRKKASEYDYSKPFHQQVDDWIGGNFPAQDTLLVGGTPSVLTGIGFPSLPITITQTNLKANINGEYRGTQEEILDHIISSADFKRLPELIADPVAIIADRRLQRNHWTVSAHVVDVMVEMEINGKQSLVPIKIDGKGMQHGATIDALSISSVHGNRDAYDRLEYALTHDSDNQILTFYVNKNKATAVLRKAGHTITGWPNSSNGFIHSITDPNSPVKLRITHQTETRQFKKWFKGSKIVNPDGTPKEMYHGTKTENGAFFEFDETKAVRRGGLGFKAMGKGNYFTAKKLNGTERYGSRVIEAYLDIKNPFVFSGGSFKEQAANVLGVDAGISYDELQAEMRRQGYDGVVQYDKNGEVSIAVTFDSNQIKSATDNIGTFDGSNPDIRYSRRKRKISTKTFANGQNSNGEFTANMLIDLGDSDSLWWTGRYNHDILGMSKSDDTEFRQFYQEIQKRTKDMAEYAESEQKAVTDSFVVQNGNGKEFIYHVELDGYMHGVVLEKIDSAKYHKAMRKYDGGKPNGRSDADIGRRIENAWAGMGKTVAGNSGDISSESDPGNGAMGTQSSESIVAGHDAGKDTGDQTVSDTSKLTPESKASRRKKSETEVLQAQNEKLREDVEWLKELVKQQMAEAAKDGVELSYEEAFEEVVCKAMEGMFTDTDDKAG